MSALLVLSAPSRHCWYLPWLRDIQSVVAGHDLDLLRAAVPVNGHGPDFLWPTPIGPLATIEDDLAQVQATSPDVVAAELSEHWSRPLTEDPVGVRDTLVAQQRLAWQLLVEPLWDRIRGLLHADITARARQLADGGLEMLFANLHRRALWQDDSLHLTGLRGGAVDLRGRGLILVPTAFGWPNLGIGPTDNASAAPPALVYPMLGAARLWEPAVRSPAVERLLGAGRAHVLAETVIPSTTASLARRLGLAAGTVSEHLTVLREAGLVAAERRSREVFYRQTPLAAALLQGHT
jgi:DNA-binding transcriptional ArsR family regulator